MFQTCVTIYTTRADGSIMRPSGRKNPNFNWAHRFAGGVAGIAISYPEDDVFPALEISPQLVKDAPGVARHIRKFAESNRLRMIVNRDLCAACGGSQACVAGIDPEKYQS
jgi:hypothetical protein